MASWFDKGRPALREALETIFNQIDADIAADLDDNSGARELAECKALLQENAAKNARLQEEVETLRADFERLCHRRAMSVLEPLPSPTSAMPNGVLESSDPEVAQKIEFTKLAQRFRLLNENFRKARGALERRKTERDTWKRRFETLQAHVQAYESEHGVEISSRASAALASLQPVTTSFGSSFSSTADANEEALEPDEPQLPPIIPPKSSASSRSAGPVLGPLDSTQGESEGNDLPSLATTADVISDPLVKRESSSDGPVVISERPVKKHKSNERTTETRQLVRVKTELEEDSSPILDETRMPVSQESIDLGHITHITTPRKPRGVESTPRLASIYKIPPADTTTNATPAATYVLHDLPAPQTARASIMSSALTPISINNRMIRSGGGRPARLSRKRQLDEGIAEIADDGTSFRDGQENTSFQKVQKRNQTPKNRLEQLLYQGETNHSPALSRSSRQARKRPFPSTAELNIPERRELPFEKQARQSRPILQPAAAAQATPRSPQRSPQRLARQGQIRHKPPRELHLDDFRVNPAANEGHEFAYSDVVRHKDDRACLPGCTEMHCCGKQFRALAISQRPDPPLTAAQRMEEQKLLEQHLGDHAYRLATMDPTERAEAWIQAKTQELANKYGKHRHRYSRMQSPPGFWNADFPSTQELEMGREEAAEREKRAIRERYREAMKPGGRWLFKDE